MVQKPHDEMQQKVCKHWYLKLGDGLRETESYEVYAARHKEQFCGPAAIHSSMRR